MEHRTRRSLLDDCPEDSAMANVVGDKPKDEVDRVGSDTRDNLD
jgi:hypothetical protein